MPKYLSHPFIDLVTTRFPASVCLVEFKLISINSVTEFSMKVQDILLGLALNLLLSVSLSKSDTLTAAEKLKNEILEYPDQHRFTTYLGTVNGKSFFANEDLTSWYGAQNYCNSVGLELAVFETEAEVKFLTGKYNESIFYSYHWISQVALYTLTWKEVVEGVNICIAYHSYPGEFEIRVGMCEYEWRTLCQARE